MCNGEQDSAHGCRSEEHLWRAVLALSVETWGTYSAGNHKPLRAAFVLGEGVGAAVPAGVWCSTEGTGRLWEGAGRRWLCPASECTGRDGKPDTNVSKHRTGCSEHVLNHSLLQGYGVSTGALLQVLEQCRGAVRAEKCLLQRELWIAQSSTRPPQPWGAGLFCLVLCSSLHRHLSWPHRYLVGGSAHPSSPPSWPYLWSSNVGR